MKRVYCALVHHPVCDREGEVVTTAVTNLDVHDLSRSCRSYELSGYFVVTPIQAQRDLIGRILEHWHAGGGKKRVPERSVALSLCETISDLESVLARITDLEGRKPLVVATAARDFPHRQRSTYAELAERLRTHDEPTLLLFGTGHGLAKSVLEDADVLLEPIRAKSSYNHLSVRAAAAITLDRLFGET